MNIGIVGLGMIGGSFAKALKTYTDAVVLGNDISRDVLNAALAQGAIDGVLNEEGLSRCDMVIVALYPKDTVEFVKQNAPFFKKGAIVTDCCGVKSFVYSNLKTVAEGGRFTFVGAHPMAGIEKGGFENSSPEMFKNTTLIVTPYEDTPREALERIWRVASRLGFTKFQITTPERHDEMIAYTSQLCHLASCAYIGSQLAARCDGFAASSFRDMTRVSGLNENMWAELFLENSEYLLKETEEFIQRLQELAELVRLRDLQGLRMMLRKSREAKEALDAMVEERK